MHIALVFPRNLGKMHDCGGNACQQCIKRTKLWHCDESIKWGLLEPGIAFDLEGGRHFKVSGSETADLFATKPIMCFPLGRERVLLSVTGKKKPYVVTRGLWEILRACSTFESLGSHAERVRSMSRGTPDAQTQVERLLLGIAEAGLFDRVPRTNGRITQEDLWSGARIQSVGFVTKNRVKHLRKALATYVLKRPTDGILRVVVVDDSEKGRTRKANQSLLREVASLRRKEAFYVGFEEKVLFRDRVARDGDIPAGVIDLCLFGHRRAGCNVGGNRNALLLQTMGEMLLSVDDDTVCDVYNTEGTPPRLDIILGRDPSFFRPLEQASFPKISNPDIFQIHETILGKTLLSLSCVIGT